ncbi:hypothetical protein AB4Z54_74480, partial [Streptomyces sp. MCAF7]
RRVSAGQPPPSPANLQSLLYQELQELDRALRDTDRVTGRQHGGQAEEFLAEVAAIVAAVGSVDTNDVRSTDRFRGIYHNEVQPLAARIERWMEEIDGEEPGVIRLRPRGGSEWP